MAPSDLLTPPAGERARQETDNLRKTPPGQTIDEFRLRERIGRALRATGYGPLRGVQVAVRDGLVTLGGRVPSYHLKQVAQAIAMSVAGLHPVCNELDVAQPS